MKLHRKSFGERVVKLFPLLMDFRTYEKPCRSVHITTYEFIVMSCVTIPIKTELSVTENVYGSFLFFDQRTTTKALDFNKRQQQQQCKEDR